VVIPLHRAVSQTLLTRPPLAGKEASFFPLPLDLHVLGLPPAFNLSHDQTLQLKFDAQRIKPLVRNELTVVHLRLDILFTSFDAEISVPRVPTQIV
jgi:hypothetical protein